MIDAEQKPRVCSLCEHPMEQLKDVWICRGCDLLPLKDRKP